MAVCGINNCNGNLPSFQNIDLSECPSCHHVHVTGNEQELRKDLEGKTSIVVGRIPGSVAARAASYCTQIYKFAKKGTAIGYDKLEARIARKYGANTAGEATLSSTYGRVHAGVADDTTGVAIIEVWHKGTAQSVPWRYVYVVFRGSVGADQKTGKRASNPLGAGVGAGGEKVDWRANFDNSQVPLQWAAAGAKVHRGFWTMYQSMRDNVVRDVLAIANARTFGRPQAQVVVTGHSLGSALATLCAFDLRVNHGVKPICLPICPPRVGNLQFVRRFNRLLADEPVVLPSENQEYRCSYAFVQRADLVSIIQKKSFAHGIDRAGSKGRRKADGTGVGAKGLYSIGKTGDSTSIFYHVSNIIVVGTIGLHLYQMAEAGIWNWTRA